MPRTYQTNQSFDSQTIAFATDLDENIYDVHVDDDDVDGVMKTYTFENPVTGSTDRVSFFEKFDDSPILYIPNFTVGRSVSWKDQIECHDLSDLYDMILIDEA